MSGSGRGGGWEWVGARGSSWVVRSEQDRVPRSPGICHRGGAA